jgi:hypothetical protein
VSDAPNVEPSGFEAAGPKRRRGAQPGNRLAQTHGGRARELNALKARVRTIVREANAALAALRASRAKEEQASLRR